MQPTLPYTFLKSLLEISIDAYSYDHTYFDAFPETFLDSIAWELVTVFVTF